MTIEGGKSGRDTDCPEKEKCYLHGIRELRLSRDGS
jgi:hypothetical protein